MLVETKRRITEDSEPTNHMERLNEGDIILYENYWDKNDSGEAEVVFIEDTIFKPADETPADEMVYTVKDTNTGREFELDDVDYWFTLKE